MRIGLIDVDSHRSPNLALMKLSAHHKNYGDTVEWAMIGERYDRVYMSKVFSFTEDYGLPINCDDIRKGGTGYRLYDQWLPDEIEHTCPDYGLYPQYDHAYGFLTRGCVNKCPFCVVPRKEGIIRPHADISEFISDKKTAILFDNNIVASDHGLEQLKKIVDMKIKIDANQGLDARIIAGNRDIANLLGRVKWIRSLLHLAFDNTAYTPFVDRAVEYLREAGIKPYRLIFYVLTKNDNIEDALWRIHHLKELGCQPYVMPYRDLDHHIEPSSELRRLSRWCNNKWVFKSCEWEEYTRKVKH